MASAGGSPECGTVALGSVQSESFSAAEAVDVPHRPQPVLRQTLRSREPISRAVLSTPASGPTTLWPDGMLVLNSRRPTIWVFRSASQASRSALTYGTLSPVLQGLRMSFLSPGVP